MTLLDQAPSTATGPTLRSTTRTVRGPVLVLLALVLTGLLAAALATTGDSRRLDPDSVAPAGSRAVAELLRGLGTEVTRVGTVEEALALDGEDRVLLVPQPEALSPGELEQLAGGTSRLVVVTPDPPALEALGLPVELQGFADVDQRRAACELPAAVRAGEVDLGGGTYRATDGESSVGCYAAGGDATLLQVPGAVVLGEGALLTNDRLDDRGNASLALGLLGLTEQQQPVEQVAWLVPRIGRAVADTGQPSLSELIADGVYAGAAWLIVVAATLALWRARRLGRVVEEPLPVVVRAAEAVEGRGRLYRAAGARGQAGEALRAATRDRLVRRVGAGLGTPRPSVVGLVAERAGADAAEVDRLLYGPEPEDDNALVRLAEALRALEKSVTQEVPRA